MKIQISSEDLQEQAKAQTELTDFGGSTYTAGLEALVESLNSDIALSEGTAGYFQQTISQILQNRLEVTRLLKEHPEILEEEIKAPLFVVGLPRSGTSALHTLLALDPLARFLRNFECCGPICPPPELMPRTPDPRYQVIHDSLDGMFSMAPHLRGINGINFMAGGTAECQNLMAHEFVHIGWSCGSSLFTHGNWVSDCDMVEAYAWHKRLLQILQWKLPNSHWVLKAPLHLFGLKQLVKVYPDARIIFTHRDPIEAMVSGVSMVVQWTQFTSGQVDIPAVAEWYPALWAKGLARALADKKHLPPEQYTEIHHQNLSRDPIGTISQAYDDLGMVLHEAAQKRMSVWLRENPRSTFGNHAYSAEELSISPEREADRFRFYTDVIGA